ENTTNTSNLLLPVFTLYPPFRPSAFPPLSEIMKHPLYVLILFKSGDEFEYFFGLSFAKFNRGGRDPFNLRAHDVDIALFKSFLHIPESREPTAHDQNILSIF